MRVLVCMIGAILCSLGIAGCVSTVPFEPAKWADAGTAEAGTGGESGIGGESGTGGEAGEAGSGGSAGTGGNGPSVSP